VAVELELGVLLEVLLEVQQRQQQA